MDEQPMILKEAEVHANVLMLDLWYPGTPLGAVDTVELGLQHVRAADSIRISYDFVRDGWKVEQASVFSWEADDEDGDQDWQEVAFIQAWGREKGEP